MLNLRKNLKLLAVMATLTSSSLVIAGNNQCHINVAFDHSKATEGMKVGFNAINDEGATYSNTKGFIGPGETDVIAVPCATKEEKIKTYEICANTFIATKGINNICDSAYKTVFIKMGTEGSAVHLWFSPQISQN